VPLFHRKIKPNHYALRQDRLCCDSCYGFGLTNTSVCSNTLCVFLTVERVVTMTHTCIWGPLRSKFSILLAFTLVLHHQTTITAHPVFNPHQSKHLHWDLTNDIRGLHSGQALLILINKRFLSNA